MGNVIFKAVVVFVILAAGTASADMGAWPLDVLSVRVDTVGLSLVSSVSIGVVAGFAVSDVSTQFLPGEGYEIVIQPPQRVAGLAKGDSAFFIGQIQALKRGTWKVHFEARGTWGGLQVGTDRQYFYIVISDTLCRAFTILEYSRMPRGRQYGIPIKKPDSVGVAHPYRPSKPAMPDSLQPRPRSHRPQGSFDLTGQVLWHDPRQPSGWLSGFANATVTAWNENEHDPNPSPDEVLGTTITDEYGCFYFSWLDSYDADGTADPYVTWGALNSDFAVLPQYYPYPYSWYSYYYVDVPEDETLDLGSYTMEGVTDEGAVWCFQHMNLAWATAEYVGPHPEFVTCVWPNASAGFINGVIGMPQSRAHLLDVMSHEYGHALMYQAYNHSIPHDCTPPQGWGLNDSYCSTHGWTEGWAYFFSLVVEQDGEIDYSYSPALVFEIEYPSLNPPEFAMDPGDGTPAQVACALQDLWDWNNDGSDENADYPVEYETIHTWGLHSHIDQDFQSFWEYLRDNELTYPQNYRGVKSIGNNTIHYTGVLRGDCNADDIINVSDVNYLINFIFAGQSQPIPYLLVGDLDCNGIVTISDAVYLITWLWGGGPAPCTFNG